MCLEDILRENKAMTVPPFAMALRQSPEVPLQPPACRVHLAAVFGRQFGIFRPCEGLRPFASLLHPFPTLCPGFVAFGAVVSDVQLDGEPLKEGCSQSLAVSSQL